LLKDRFTERPFISFTERPLFELKDFLAARFPYAVRGVKVWFNGGLFF
jgi:hypothetical protein